MGEAFCRPAVDAMCFGNTPIVTDNTGMADYISKNTGWIVPSYETPVVTDDAPLPFIYSAKETWFEIDILKLRSCMREAYEQSTETKNEMQNNGKKLTGTFSHQSIGRNIEGAIDAYASK